MECEAAPDPREKPDMQIDPATQPPATTYKLLTNLVVPRPIAWVSTISKAGVINLAPFSFFNAVGSDPPYVVVSIGRRDDGTAKDTANNIAESGEFVVNLVTESLLMAMNISAADFPPDQSELTAVGLLAERSVSIQPPRVAAAQASLECKLFQTLPLGANTLFIGEVVMFHVADQLVGDRIHISDFEPIGRLGSPSVYCRTADRFEIQRTTYQQWLHER
jgi:flavin reductase (DIM6/NTAB) family NADH-FMN oxidoreductase RutF